MSRFYDLENCELVDLVDEQAVFASKHTPLIIGVDDDTVTLYQVFDPTRPGTVLPGQT